MERQAFVFSFGASSYDPTPITLSTDFSFQIASAQRDRLLKSAWAISRATQIILMLGETEQLRFYSRAALFP
jgi:hypothetical protein